MVIRMDTYRTSLREEQKLVLDGLLGLIYDSFDRTTRIQHTVDSIYRITVAILVILILFVAGVLAVVCYFGCRRYQGERSPLHQSRQKSAPIEI